MKEIVAGIINTTTGEITDTITNPSYKIKLALKVRDELNSVHGKNAYMEFHFNFDGNVSFVKRHMKSDASLTKDLDLLSLKYRLYEYDVNISILENDLAVAQSVLDDNSGDSEKNQLIRDLVENEFDKISRNIKSEKFAKQQIVSKINKFIQV